MSTRSPTSLVLLPRRQKGVSLVELMVAMAIGLVVIGAVFTNYLNNSVGVRQTAAMAQVTSDASLALGILRNHIAIAGYGTPTGVGASGMSSSFTGPALIGCENGFANLTADATAITCAAAPAAPGAGIPPAPVRNSLMVRYTTDTHISPVTQITQGSATIDVPTDCTGHRLDAVAGVFIADSRFHIHPGNNATPPSLQCRGNSVTPQSVPLIDNIVAMEINYGVAAPDTDTAGKLLRVTRYVSASKVAEPGVTAEWDRLWSEVLAVRVCVVVRSAEEVLPSATAYMDCNQTAATPTDRRIYRAFTSTVLLNNRLSSKSLP